MANQVEVEVKGMDELMRELDRLSDRASGRVQNAALRAAAEPILEDAVRNAPEDTGKGKQGLKISRPRKQRAERYVLVGIGRGDNSEIFYMKFHEFGTSKMKARPFLGPAYEKNKKRVLDIIRGELRRGLRR